MTRSTNRQLTIFKAHLDAFKNATWTSMDPTSIQELKELLKEGKTSWRLWNDIRAGVDLTMKDRVLITDDFFGDLSERARKKIQHGFGNFLTTINII